MFQKKKPGKNTCQKNNKMEAGNLLETEFKTSKLIKAK